MTKLNTLILGISSICIVGLGIVVLIQHEKLKTVKLELQIANEEADSLEESCKFLEDQKRKSEDALNKFIEESAEASKKEQERLDEIKNAEDAKDWIADPLPESVKLLFCDINKRNNSYD